MPGMLKRTLILPIDTPDLAAKYLQSAIDDLAVVPMLVFGQGETVERVVDWADQLASRGGDASGRRVVWIRDRTPAPIAAALGTLKGLGANAQVAVVNFHQEVKQQFDDLTKVSPLELEGAFLAGECA